MIETDVLVVGTSLSSNMTTLNLKHRNPGLDVTALGPLPDEERRPLVGESLVEPGILFFREVGLGDHLDRMQLLKNGLIFYHKLDLSNPADRAYSVHAPRILHHKARQLRRVEFDEACRARARALGVKLLHGKADEISVGTGGARHRVRATVDGAPVEITARWLVDASGRRRVVGNKVTRYVRPAEQRCTFWFRLRGFEPFTRHLQGYQRRPLDYDPWLTTHHFMGKGYWIWCIPLEIGDDNLASIGFTYRPDLFPRLIRSVDDFLAQVEQDHPVVADMVRSGTIVDTQQYLNYAYRSERLYSEDGWFLVGDSARTVDPLYSNGISMTTVQVGQITELIERQRDGRLKPGDVDALDAAGRWIMERAQREVTEQYLIMHDPFQACMRRYLNVTQWFNLFLPMWWNGFFNTPEAARVLLSVVKDRDEDAESLWGLAGEASASIRPWTQAGFDRGPDIDELLNLRFDCTREQVMEVASRVFARRREFRWKLVRLTGYRSIVRELPRFVRETIRPIVFRLLPRRHPEAFAMLRPPLPDQYARWTGDRRFLPERDVAYVGRGGAEAAAAGRLARELP